MEKVVAVSIEHRFYVHDNKLYSKLAFPYSYWKDYLSYFDRVVIVARTQDVESFENGFVRVDGPGVEFFQVPYYVGPLNFIKSLPRLLSALYRVAGTFPVFIMRSGNVTNLLWIFVMLKRRRYLREYPGDILEGVSGYVGKGVGVLILAKLLDFLGRVQGRFSRANSFVSESCKILYSSDRPSYVFSSFSVSEVTKEKLDFSVGKRITLVSVGRLEKEKGHITLIEAASILGNECINLLFIGDGTQRKILENACIQKGINALFAGSVTDRAVLFEKVSGADIFVLPSLTEGMPRALLEAMAMGMPCIGTSVGGIPEVLEPNCLFSPGDAARIAQLVREFRDNEDRRRTEGRRNKAFVASRFSEKAMSQVKKKFWGALYE